jgi:hypothetical protein
MIVLSLNSECADWSTVSPRRSREEIGFASLRSLWASS